MPRLDTDPLLVTGLETVDLTALAVGVAVDHDEATEPEPQGEGGDEREHAYRS